MTRFYQLRAPRGSPYTGDLEAHHRWGALPGLHCPTCEATWAGGMAAYPSVDLSAWPEREAYAMSRPEPFDEFVRLRERVRPFLPEGARLLPGTRLGPLVGRAEGTFGSFFLHVPGLNLMRHEAWERLRAEGLSGLRGVSTELIFQPPDSLRLVELELLPLGRLHPDCTPARPPACARCGRDAFRFPDAPILEGASLPTGVDLFLLSDFETIRIATGRFVEAVRRLGLDDVDIRELPVR